MPRRNVLIAAAGIMAVAALVTGAAAEDSAIMKELSAAESAPTETPIAVPAEKPKAAEKIAPSRPVQDTPPPVLLPAKPEFRDQSPPPASPRKSPEAELPVAGKVGELRLVNNIRVSGNTVDIIGSGLDTYKAFTLTGPPRLVLDILRVQNTLKTKTAQVKIASIRSCRIGEDAGNFRIVFDYAGEQTGDYKIEKTGSGLRVTFLDRVRR